jgi:hypothetical protein
MENGTMTPMEFLEKWTPEIYRMMGRGSEFQRDVVALDNLCPHPRPRCEECKLIEMGLACPCGKDPDSCMTHAPGGLADMAEGRI